MDAISLLIGFTVGSLVTAVVLAIAKKSNPTTAVNEADVVRQELKTERELSNTLRNELLQLTALKTKAEAEFKNAQEALSTERKLVDELKVQMKSEFKLLSNDIFEERAKKLTESNETQLSQVIAPLKESLIQFRSKLEESDKQDVERITALKTEIQTLMSMSQQVSSTAENLTKALKGDNKTQGNWGEMILESILERSGLTRGVEFTTQHTTTNDDNDKIRPDVIINLPENKHIIVDSKVSLTAFENYINAETESDKALFLKQHADSVKAHATGLSAKKYETAEGIIAPDFVLLFMPIEAAFSTALTADPNLFQFAWDKNIVIVSPTTLLATLRTVANIWSQEKRTKNAEKIAKEAGAFVDKLVGLHDTLKTLEKNLQSSVKTYETAMGQLATGKGNLMKRASDLKELGAKTTKSIENKLSSEDENE